MAVSPITEAVVLTTPTWAARWDMLLALLGALAGRTLLGTLRDRRLRVQRA